METDTSTTEERRKSLGLLRDIAEKWTAEKYSRADSADDGPRPQPQLKMSSMEEECVRERIRMTLLRECADILDAETKYTRETFRRAFLNKTQRGFGPKPRNMFDQNKKQETTEIGKHKIVGPVEIILSPVDPRRAYVDIEGGEREAHLLSTLRHPHVIGYLGHGPGPQDGVVEIWMEYASGGSLASKLRAQGPLAEQDAVDLMAQLVLALDFLHDRGIVHGDLSTSNLLLGGDSGRIVKVADFGLARWKNSSVGTSSRPARSNPAPELLAGAPPETPTDIWDSGRILLETLGLPTPGPPCRPKSPTLPQWCSVPLRDLLTGLLAQDPLDRPTARMLMGHPFLTISVHKLPTGSPIQAFRPPTPSAAFLREVLRKLRRFRRLCQELLSKMFQLFDQDRDSHLVQEDWIEFLKERLVDEKQIDLADQLESVAYVLCGDEKVSLDKFCQIFQAKGIVDKLFRLVDHDSDGITTAAQIMQFLANITNSRKRSGFDKSNLEWLEQLFRQTVGNEKEIRRDDFKKILITKNPFFTERVFQIFDKDNSGSISLQEFLDSMHQFTGQSPDDKMKFLFKVYDLDGDGLIQHRELQHVMRACMEENGMRFSEEQIDDLTMALFEDADAESRGAITYESLKNQLEKHDGLLQNLSISIDRWLVPPKPKTHHTSLLRKIVALKPYQLSLPYIRNNYVYLIFAVAFFLVNLGLFVSRAIQYRHSNYYVIFARACGQCLNFNCMFVLVLMLRHSITFLRTRGFSNILPLDQHIYFHKLTGVCIFLYSVLHTIMHLLNFGFVVVPHPEINAANYTYAEWILTDKPGLFGLVPGIANPTGVALIIILVIMVICSQTFVRRGGSFEIFYWTHLLYIPFWILVLLHGPNFWKWFIVPGIIYVTERILRFSWMRAERGKTYISSGLLLPSRVTHLVIKRPPHFDFHPGDYVFVNIPAIAKYEWHPFTISSAPEQEDYMWLHIRGVGEWTNRLHNYFEKEQEKLHNIGEELPKLGPSLIGIPTENKALKRIQASIKNKFTSKEQSGTSLAKIVAFKKEQGSYANEGYASDENIHGSTDSDISIQQTSQSNDAVNLSGTSKKGPQARNLHMMLLQKTPLAKSLSMPDIDNRSKKRQRLLVLREYMRSESEKSFDECQIRRARLQSLGLAYLSPQNKSLAQSFRYMRNKPTIIAFKTPSLENCEAKLSALSIINREDGGLINSDRAAEEGRAQCVPSGSDDSKTHTQINYPVGKPLEIFLDGPYGAPSSHIFRAQHAVLIATGIGVTPFASILQSIMHRYWKARHSCPNCKHTWVSEIPPTIMHLRKVDFFWINRDQRSFEWFVNLLSQLEIEQAELGGAMERFLEMHMYITSALQKTDMKAVGLQLALDLLHEKEKRDLITGLKTRTNAGRPNWDKVFKHLLDQKKGKVTVFYCGPPQLARILRLKCDQFGFSFRKEVF